MLKPVIAQDRLPIVTAYDDVSEQIERFLQDDIQFYELQRCFNVLCKSLHTKQ